jgi:hypothetical protein
VSVAKGSDELWVGVKCQSNAEIAGSPRNVLRYSLGRGLGEVEHCCCAGVSQPTKWRQTPNAPEPCPGVRRPEQTSVVERETTQTRS